MKHLTPEQISIARNSLGERMMLDQITIEEYDYICYLEQYVLNLKNDISNIDKQLETTIYSLDRISNKERNNILELQKWFNRSVNAMKNIQAMLKI